MCAVSTHQAVPSATSVLTLSTRRWRQTPQVKTVPQACPTIRFRHQSSPGCHLCVWPTGCKSEVPTTPWGLSSLREWLIGLRKTFYSQDDWFIIKDIIPEQADGRDVKGKIWGKGCRACMPSPDVSPFQYLHQPRNSPNPVVYRYLWKLHYAGTSD